MSQELAAMRGDLMVNLDSCLYEFERAKELEDRRLYLYGSILNIDDAENLLYYDSSTSSKFVEFILHFNRVDKDIPVEERKPIRLYINSPGGDVTEGFALISAMELSKTPIHTINVGEWCSMAFLIGITGSKRYSLPSSIFMMHEPSGLTVGKFSDMEDKVEFNKRFNNLLIKKHVLAHSKMTPQKYNSISKKDFYMLADDALKYGFIDEIVTDIDSIL